MSEAIINVNVDQLLSVDKFVPDETSHIQLSDKPSDEEFEKLVRVCPAALYKISEDGSKRFDHSGCLECGTCRIACGGTAIVNWRYPDSGYGIQYRYG